MLRSQFQPRLIYQKMVAASSNRPEGRLRSCSHPELNQFHLLSDPSLMSLLIRPMRSSTALAGAAGERHLHENESLSADARARIDRILDEAIEMTEEIGAMGFFDDHFDDADRSPEHQVVVGSKSPTTLKISASGKQ